MWIYTVYVNQSLFFGFMKTLTRLYFMDLCKTRKSVCSLWIYARHVNQFVVCGFMQDMIQPVFYRFVQYVNQSVFCWFIAGVWISTFFFIHIEHVNFSVFYFCWVKDNKQSFSNNQWIRFFKEEERCFFFSLFAVVAETSRQDGN